MLTYNILYIASLLLNMCIVLTVMFLLDCSVVQTFGSTDEEEVLRAGSLYSIYFVVLAFGVGAVQFTWVSHCLSGKS